jgi:Mg-chelatase subunit ChlD
MTEGETTTEENEGIIERTTTAAEKLTDNGIAYLVVGVVLGMAAYGLAVPDWLVVAFGLVMAFYFKSKT